MECVLPCHNAFTVKHVKAVFNEQKWSDAMAARVSEYQCAGSFFWIDLGYNAVPDIPVSQAAIRHFSDQILNAGKLPFPTTIAIPGPSYDVKAHLGKLKRVSPEEPEMAMIFALDNSLRMDGSYDNAEKVKTILLSMTLEFKVLATPEACFLCQVNLREYITGLFTVAARSAVQRIIELMLFRDRQKTKMSASDLALKWIDEVKMASISEKVTADFVRQAQAVYDNMFKNGQTFDIIMAAEQEWGKQSPFDSVYKLSAIVSKCTSVEQNLWVCASIVDAVKNGFMTAPEFSVRSLSGKGSGNFGIIDLCLLKSQLYKYISTDFLNLHRFSSTIAKKIHGMSSHAGCRNLFGYKNEKATNMQWLGTLPESGWKLCTLVENMIYSISLDSDLRTMGKDGKTAREIMEEPPFKDRIEEVLSALENENSKDDDPNQIASNATQESASKCIRCHA